MKTIITYFAVCCLMVVWGGCADEDASGSKTDKALISLSLRASSGGINEDIYTGEDRVTEVRMLVFDPSGNTVYNDMLKFTNGFEYQCDAVKINPGTYDFYFIANETVYAGFSAALAVVANISQFQSDPRFIQLQYNPDFSPNTTSSTGRFLMSAGYKNITVYRGGTETNPKLLELPTNEVELIRSLAKVEVIFRKKTPGAAISVDNSISSVRLQKVAATFSLPPLDDYYTGTTAVSNTVIPANFDYGNDSIGSVIFYIPEFLNQAGGTDYTELSINNQVFPIQTDNAKTGLTAQRRNVLSLSDNCVIRNYHYKINAYINSQGGVQIQTCVETWNKAPYIYMFQDPGQIIVIPPVIPTDSSVIVPTSCGKIEIHSTNEFLSQGLMGAFGDQILWWDPAVQGPNIIEGEPPCYCEKKYGPGWRLINSCELMSFLALFDETYRIWHSNTDQAATSHLPFYSLPFRQQAQVLLGKLTGVDMSRYTLSDTGKDALGDAKLGIIDAFFTPGDIVVTLKQYPSWPYPSPPFPGIENWFPMEVVHQVKGYWYSGYLIYSDPANYDKVLYQQFQRYNFSSTVSRCVRSVE